MSKVMDGGIVTAYGAAVRGGYTGTYQQFCAALGQLTEVLEEFEGFSVEVTTLSPGAPATANYHDGVLTLGIPRGETGNGIQSAVLNSDYTLTLTWTNGQHTTVGPIRGAVGATPNLTIGNVQTLQPSQPATATITGTPEDPALNFGIPKGDPGTNGISPAVTITEITDGHRVTITDGDHPQGQSFDVMDGQDGASDAGDVTYDETATYQSGTVGAELSSQKNAIDEKAPVIINEVSGDIATFADGADGMPIKHLIANIEPVRAEGTPSPENPLPITGWTGLSGQACGKNLLPSEAQSQTINGVTFTVNTDEDGALISITANGTATDNTIYNIMRHIDVKAGWILSGTPSIGRMFCSNQGGTVDFARSVNGAEGVVNQDAEDAKVYILVLSGTTLNNAVFLPMLRASSTDSTYEPYQGDTISVSWASEAGTVYGGTLDVVTGELKVTHCGSDLGGFTWHRHNDGYYYSGSVTQLAKPNSASINSIFPSSQSASGDRLYIGYAANIYAFCASVSTAEDFKTLVTGQTLVYELATPIVYQLDPVTVNTLLGNNTVYVDCGSVTVDYPADTGIVVAEQSNAIDQKQDATSYVTLSGTIVTQTGADNTMYLCGELAELTFTAPQTGMTAIRFTSGTTPTVATFTNVTWLNGFDPSALEASTTYEINILNGLGCAAWT